MSLNTIRDVGAGIAPTPTTTRAPSREIPLRGYIIVLSGTVVWAMTSIFIKILLTRYGMEPLSLAFWRVFIMTAFLFAALRVLNANQLRIASGSGIVFLFSGLIGVALHQIVWITSVQYNGAAVATLLVYIGPAVVAVFAWRFLHEKMDRTKLLALALTLIGCALVSRAYDLRQVQLNILGLIVGIGTGFTFATYTLLGRIATRRNSAWTSLFYPFLFGTLFLLPANFFTRDFFPLRASLDGWAVLIFLALVPTLGGFASYTIGLTHLPASVVSLLAAFEPVSTAIFAYFVFGEVLDAPQLVGAGLILCSVILLRPKNGA